MVEGYYGRHEEPGSGFDFDAAEVQFDDSGVAGIALEGFGLSHSSYPVYSSVENNKHSEHRWTGQPNEYV
ncbi:MAG TPA: hypothetical protein VFX79_01660 [Candidatus Saccharimonadales bacterium]|nr:hypothetical protein [Candidatus Saccharimonadales bacterium]